MQTTAAYPLKNALADLYEMLRIELAEAETEALAILTHLASKEPIMKLSVCELVHSMDEWLLPGQAPENKLKLRQITRCYIGLETEKSEEVQEACWHAFEHLKKQYTLT